VLKDIFTRQDTCEVCNLKYDRENGFFLGGIPVSYALICIFWIVPWLIAYFFGWAPVLWTVLGYDYSERLLLPISVMPTVSAYGWGIYFCFAKHEMPPLDSPNKANE
jgi:predicted permease